MKIHDLKTTSEMFHEVEIGNKTCEIRLNDRDFQKGDLLLLRELISGGGGYTGKTKEVRITHVLSGWGLKENYVALSFEPVPESVSQKDDVKVEDLPF
jgi:hypothetical protein